MTDNEPLSEKEREQLEELRNRQLLENYRDKVERRLDSIPPEAIEYANTGIGSYDDLGPEPKYKWLAQMQRLSGEKLPNNNVLVSSSGTVHFIEYWKESWDDEYPVPYCRSAQMKGDVVPVTNVRLTEKKYCQTCLKNKQNMQAAQIAARDC